MAEPETPVEPQADDEQPQWGILALETPEARPFFERFRAPLICALIGLVLCVIYYVQAELPNHARSLAEIRADGELRVLYCDNPQTETHDLPPFESQLVEGFADTLGVRVKYHPVRSTDDLYTALEAGEADMACVPLPPTPAREMQFLFSRPIRAVHHMLITSAQSPLVDIESLSDQTLSVPKNGLDVPEIEALRLTHPKMKFREINQPPDLIAYGVVHGDYDLTLVNSQEFERYQAEFPGGLKSIAFFKEKRYPIAFPMPADATALCDALNRFLNEQLPSVNPGPSAPKGPDL